MTELEEHIKRINGKLQQLLKQHQQLQQSQAELVASNTSLQQQLANSQEQNQLLQQQVLVLKSATGQLSDAEKKSFEKQLNTYIREIDKCIGLLSE